MGLYTIHRQVIMDKLMLIARSLFVVLRCKGIRVTAKLLICGACGKVSSKATFSVDH